jgi:hypothetical protein
VKRKQVLLASGQDFADKRERGGAFNGRDARKFIVNYYAGPAKGTQHLETCNAGDDPH